MSVSAKYKGKKKTIRPNLKNKSTDNFDLFFVLDEMDETNEMDLILSKLMIYICTSNSLLER